MNVFFIFFNAYLLNKIIDEKYRNRGYDERYIYHSNNFKDIVSFEKILKTGVPTIPALLKAANIKKIVRTKRAIAKIQDTVSSFNLFNPKSVSPLSFLLFLAIFK